MKKKFLAAILTAAMVLGLTACGGSADTAASSDVAAADTTETTEIKQAARRITTSLSDAVFSFD